MILESLRDLWLVLRLQKQVEPLDPKGTLLRPATPFLLATARRLPVFDSRSGRVLTATCRHDENAGFVQARWRGGLPVLDLLYIAPSLNAQSGAAWIWHDLLQELVRVGNEYAVQRLFAHLPKQQHAEVEVLRQAGFAIYSQDRLFRRHGAPHTVVDRIEWRPRTVSDAWGLSQLYYGTTPAVVKQAELLMARPEHGNGHVRLQYAGWLRNHRGVYVLPGAHAGETSGYLKLTKGEHAHWLKLILHPSVIERADALLDQALALIQRWPQRPVYCDVRPYEENIMPALYRAGFEETAQRMLLVRQTAASMRIKSLSTAMMSRAVGKTASTFFLEAQNGVDLSTNEESIEHPSYRNHRRHRSPARHHAPTGAGSPE